MLGQPSLWAPWRMEFIKGPKNNYCFLCNHQKSNETSPEEELIVYRGTHCFVILNRFPYNSGHLLIAPYKHVGDISALSSAERHEIIDLCSIAKEKLSSLMQPEAFNIGFNLGVAAGAGVADHIHMHVVPRWTGDTNFMPVISNTRCVPEALTDTANAIRDNW